MVKACSGRQFGLCRQSTYRTVFLPTTSMSGFKPQSLQTSTTPSLSLQSGSTSNPSTVLPGPLSMLHLSPHTPSADSPPFNPYCPALQPPTPTPNHPNHHLTPNM